MSIKKFFCFIPLATTLIGLSSGCRRSEKFPDIGTSLPSPTDVAADKTGGYFYVLNADYPRDFNVGSIVTITSTGEKIASLTVPRLGRSLTRAGDDLLATFSSRGDEGGQTVQLYDLSNPKSPTLAKEFVIDGRCNPINAVMREGYKYFAVTCAGGQLLVGELKTPRSDSTLVLVRSYPGPRRALHINTKRNLLLAFPTNLNDQTWSDNMMTDTQTWDESGGNNATITATENTPNEVPDEMESSFYLRNNKARRGMYQYAVYNIAEAAATLPKDGGPFPYKEGDSVQPELRWVYFNLLNFDGSPDVVVTSDNGNLKKRYYRTNFWQAQPDTQNDDVFYLSHRGYSTSSHPGSPHANSIVKVQLTGNILDKKLKTDAVLSFQRVYGFKGELDPSGRYYPCSFQIQQVKGEPLLLVNHFRDLINFPGDQVYFSLAAKVLGDNSWFTEKATTDVSHSYYQVALTPSGRGMAISFYGNVAILLDAFPGVDINEIKTIN